jgi:hypothetical protein
MKGRFYGKDEHTVPTLMKEEKPNRERSSRQPGPLISFIGKDESSMRSEIHGHEENRI